MLEAGWQLYEGEYFQHRVEISGKELEFLTSRMTSLATVGSILSGFAFTALVELEIDDEVEENLEKANYPFMENIYYISTGISMAAGIYMVVVSTIAVMKAQRMALHGNIELDFLREELPANLGFRPGMIGEDTRGAGARDEGADAEALASLRLQQAQNDDVQQAIVALRKVQPTLLYAFAASLASFVIAATAMSWIKTCYHHLQVQKREEKSDLNNIAITLTSIFGACAVAIGVAILWLRRLFDVDTFHASSLASPHHRAQQQSDWSVAPLAVAPGSTSAPA